MIEWSEEQQLIRDTIRRFVQEEIVPHQEELEHGDMPPYGIIRKMYQTFGVDEVARQRFERAIEREEALERGEEAGASDGDGGAEDLAIDQLLSLELCRYSSGIVTAMGVTQLAAGAIMSQGTVAQKKRWGLDLLTAEKVGSWAITEPGSGSDAFGGMQSTARLDADGNYVLNGSKTFITNGPFADTIVFICKLAEEGVEPRQRKIMTFVLDSGMEGLEQSGRLRKMGLHSSPTGQLFLDNVVAGPERVLGGVDRKKGSKKKSDPRATFAAERVGVVSMSLGVIERCLELCIDYAKERVQWEKPIGEYQLIQLKLAEMEVARFNTENMLFNYLERKREGKPMSFAEASAMKLYSTKAAVEVASEAIQLFGGNGYMAEYQVEQLYRDARVMRIYAGTDEMQVRAIARDLLSR